MAGQTFSYLQHKDYLERTIKLMEQFNGADLAIQLLRDPTTPVEKPSIFSYNFFFPKIEQFRYINMSQTNFPLVRHELMLDPSAITLNGDNHVANVDFHHYPSTAIQFVPEQTPDVGFIFSDNLLQVPSPPQTYHDATGGALNRESIKSPSSDSSTASHPLSHQHSAASANNYAHTVNYSASNSPPLTRVKHYAPQSHAQEPAIKRQRTESYTPNTSAPIRWHQYEVRATHSPSQDEDSRPELGSDEECRSPAHPAQYSALLTTADMAQLPTTLDQMALVMYYNQNVHTATRPNAHYDTRIQPLPSNSMYYNNQ